MKKLHDLIGKKGKAFWRSIEELAGDPEIQDCVKHEFPQTGALWDIPMTRRSFLKFMGAQIMMLYLAGCSRTLPDKIVPYVKSPEEIIPGRPLFFASALSYAGFGRGVLVESNMGRPTKIEGNPQHPDSLGFTDAITQALLYQLYDPDRSDMVMEKGLPSSWEDFKNVLQQRLMELKKSQGRGLRFLSKPIISPSLAFARQNILKKYPLAQWHQYSALYQDYSRKAYFEIFGKEVQPIYHVEKADRILSIESDFLTQGAGAIAYSSSFANRRGGDKKEHINRLYALESTPTLTGSMADHRLVMPPTQLGNSLAFLCRQLGLGHVSYNSNLSNRDQDQLNAIAQDLREHHGRSLVVAGSQQPVPIQMMVCYLNDTLHNVGNTIDYLPVIEELPEDMTMSLRQLTNDLNKGEVTDLIVLDVNPVYASPYDLHFLKAFQKADFKVHGGLYFDETAQVSDWHIPMTHELESWGDTKAFDGTVSIRQPLMGPLYNGRNVYEISSIFLEEEYRSSLEAVRSFWKRRLDRLDFDFFWEKTVHDGVMEGTSFKPINHSPQIHYVTTPPIDNALTLLIRPDPYILDGEFSNNSLLQELPKPLTRLTWDNAVLISPKTAASLDLSNGEGIEIAYNDRLLEAPVWILPGQANQTLTIHLGYGRSQPGLIGNKLGFNAYELLNSSFPYELMGISVRKTGRHFSLANVQHHSMIDSKRHPVIVGNLSDYEHDPAFAARKTDSPQPAETLYEPKEHLHGQYQWGMLIDLNRCTGCSACTMACQVENNIPVVGKEQVMNHREMHWIRVDRYYDGSIDHPKIYHQPIPCMQCENAPCEVVCPVEATSHSEEGLNEMTYNRCIGTRYCSNNCPYKVRRFNFYEFAKPQRTTALHLSQNPDVTVRARGVMEKCTYCVQRINKARIDAKNENRTIRDGEIVPACQQACPAGAIVFGNITDSNAKVSQAKASPLNYGLLEELGTRPRTTYLAKIINPNPKMEPDHG